jgi:hypothetical protein
MTDVHRSAIELATANTCLVTHGLAELPRNACRGERSVGGADANWIDGRERENRFPGRLFGSSDRNSAAEIDASPISESFDGAACELSSACVDTN